MKLLPSERRAAFARWSMRLGLTLAQGNALLVGLARAGIYMQVDEDGGARLRLMGGDAGQATIRGLMVLHGLGPRRARANGEER